MKLNGKCPKCQSSQIIRIPVVFRTGNDNIIPAGGLKYPKVTRYVCENCGFTEEWIDNFEDIQILARNFQRI